MITRTTSTQVPAPKQDFLNPSQRRELKNKLLDKFTKFFGLSSPAVVSAMIDDFFKSGVQVNSKTLAELERNIKAECLKHKTNDQKLKAEPVPQQTYTTPYIADSTQVDFSKDNIKTTNNKTQEENDEEEDFDELAYYKSYILKQEKEVELKRKELQKKSVRAQLDQQITIKNEKKEQDKLHEQKYAEYEHEKYLNAQRRADMMAQKAKDEKQKLLDMQRLILEDRAKKLALEKENDRNLDLKITACLKEDFSKTKKEAAQKAEDQKKMAAQVMRENEERKRRKEQQEAQQKKEEMELQAMADRLAQEQEERRNAEIKARSDRINSMIKAGENMLNSVNTRKNEEEARIMKYWKRKNEKTDQKEAFFKQQEKENKVLYRQFLDAQIKEKRELQDAEKQHIKEQGLIWDADCQMYAQNRAQKAASNREEVREYKDTLDEQIRQRQEKTMKQTRDFEAEKEELLHRIHDLESTKQGIEARLAVFG